MTFRDDLIEHYREVHQRLVDVPPPPETPPKFRPAVRRQLPPVITPAHVAWARYLHGGWLAGPPPPSLEQIRSVVCRYYGVRVADILGDRRTAEVLRPRHVAMYLESTLTAKSLSELGRRFSRDHTSVRSAVRRIAILAATDAQLAADIAAIRLRLEGSATPDAVRRTLEGA